MKATKLKNGLTPLQNLKMCIGERTAVATTFERAIEDQGLTMEIVYLISKYYEEDISLEDYEYIGVAE